MTISGAVNAPGTKAQERITAQTVFRPLAMFLLPDEQADPFQQFPDGDFRIGTDFFELLLFIGELLLDAAVEHQD